MSRDYLQALERIALAAAEEERLFRKEAQRRIEALARARVAAYRRLNVLKSMVEAASGKPEREAAIAAQVARVSQLTGWSESDAGWQDFRAALAAVAGAIHADLNEGGDASADVEAQSVTEAFQAFERWYASHYGSDFLALLDQEPAFQPVVDF